MFLVDVKDSMRLATRLDAEDWHRILDRFFAILADAIHRFEGTINQFTGNGLIALFGAPLAQEDHAQRACHAALHAREQVRLYAQELKRTRGLPFAVRMGLNSGEVIVGAIGALAPGGAKRAPPCPDSPVYLRDFLSFWPGLWGFKSPYRISFSQVYRLLR